jgi:glycogen debranching enzyme
VQGYVYAALIARARFAEEAGDGRHAARLLDRARELKARFNHDFWLEERGWLAMGLDRDKKPLDALTSNMGHCLWTGILDDDKAERVGALLASDAMFSGWGVRTLADSMVGYNPISYHNGSVWPHDTAICVAGLMRYGFVEAAHRVMGGMVDAAGAFGDRLPELFAGLPRLDFPVPVRYPTSCSPQAWAAASPLLMLRAVLGFEPDVRRSRLHLAPRLPDWMGRLTVERVPLMGGRVSFEVADGRCTVSGAPEGLEIVAAPPPTAN